MLTSLALIFLVGLAMGAICQRLKLPRIIGMLITGIVLGPYVLDFLDPSILSISADLRKMALIIILLKAGLSLDLNDLKKVGRPAIMLSFVPASFEIIGYVLLAPWILGITRVEAAVMGAVLAAVSPAVVVPRMVNLMESKYGTEKAIPQMIMAGASCDDIFVIVLFTTFLSMAQGGNADVLDFVNVPVSIVLGILLGAVVGYGLYLFFETSYAHKHCVRNSTKVIIVLGVSFLLVAAEGWLEGKVAVSGLLAVVSMACVLKLKSTAFVSKRLSEKFGKDCSGSHFICIGRCSSGYPLYLAGGSGCNCHDFTCIAFSCMRGITLCCKDQSFVERARFLCDRISAESDGTGRNRLGSFSFRTGMWKDRAVGSCYGDHHYGTAWRIWNGSDIPEVFTARKIINYLRICLAASTIFLKLASVSGTPRVFKPQSGFTHSFSLSILVNIRLSALTISSTDGTRGEWMSYTPGPTSVSK